MRDFKTIETVIDITKQNTTQNKRRIIEQFYGDGLIVGGGWSEEPQAIKPSIRKSDNFYTIDIDYKAEPDAVIDITNEIQCSILPSKRFNLIYFEHFPYFGKNLLKAFSIARRILKDDGILIYCGGSNKSDSSIPEILRNSGFANAIKKEIDPKDPKAYRDNGSISLASDTSLEIFQENFSKLSNTMQFYLNYYQFFSEVPYSKYGTDFLFFNRFLEERVSSIMDLSIFNTNKKGLIKDISCEDKKFNHPLALNLLEELVGHSMAEQEKNPVSRVNHKEMDSEVKQRFFAMKQILNNPQPNFDIENELSSGDFLVD